MSKREHPAAGRQIARGDVVDEKLFVAPSFRGGVAELSQSLEKFDMAAAAASPAASFEEDELPTQTVEEFLAKL